MSVTPVPPGQRDPSWPWYLRSGMFVWSTFQDSDGPPLGRIAGAVEDGVRKGQPAYVSCEDYPPRNGVDYNIKVTHPMFLLPCHPDKRERAEAALAALFPATTLPSGGAS